VASRRVSEEGGANYGPEPCAQPAAWVCGGAERRGLSQFPSRKNPEEGLPVPAKAATAPRETRK